jgi:hypothetical protein
LGYIGLFLNGDVQIFLKKCLEMFVSLLFDVFYPVSSAPILYLNIPNDLFISALAGITMEETSIAVATGEPERSTL